MKQCSGNVNMKYINDERQKTPISLFLLFMDIETKETRNNHHLFDEKLFKNLKLQYKKRKMLVVYIRYYRILAILELQGMVLPIIAQRKKTRKLDRHRCYSPGSICIWLIDSCIKLKLFGFLIPYFFKADLVGCFIIKQIT